MEKIELGPQGSSLVDWELGHLRARMACHHAGLAHWHAQGNGSRPAVPKR
jgi:hypothetical protein